MQAVLFQALFVFCRLFVQIYVCVPILAYSQPALVNNLLINVGFALCSGEPDRCHCDLAVVRARSECDSKASSPFVCHTSKIFDAACAW